MQGREVRTPGPSSCLGTVAACLIVGRVQRERLVSHRRSRKEAQALVPGLLLRVHLPFVVQHPLVYGEHVDGDFDRPIIGSPRDVVDDVDGLVL